MELVDFLIAHMRRSQAHIVIVVIIFSFYSIILGNLLGCDSIVNLNFTYNDMSAINNNNTNQRTLIKITDILGRKTNGRKNKFLFYIFDDGTVEKRIIID